jgi:hypothetical protein
VLVQEFLSVTGVHQHGAGGSMTVQIAIEPLGDGACKHMQRQIEVALEPLHDGPGEHMQRQVVRTTGFGVGAREPEATEGLHAY